ERGGRRWHGVRRADFDVGFVPARRLGGQTGDGRALGRVGRGLGDRDREADPLFAHAPGHGWLRAGVLVRPVPGGALPGARLAADTFDGGAVRGGDAGVGARPRGPDALLWRP